MRMLIYIFVMVLSNIHSQIYATTYDNNVSHAPLVPSLSENTVDSLLNLGLNCKTVYNKRQRHSKVTNGTGVPALHTTEKSVVVQAGNLSSTGLGLALDLSNNTDYISIPNASELQFGAEKFTIEFWVKLNNTPKHIYDFAFYI